MNAYQRIQRAQRKNEREVLKQIKEAGGYWIPPLYLPPAIRNAIQRLEKQGKIAYRSFLSFHPRY